MFQMFEKLKKQNSIIVAFQYQVGFCFRNNIEGKILHCKIIKPVNRFNHKI